MTETASEYLPPIEGAPDYARASENYIEGLNTPGVADAGYIIISDETIGEAPRGRQLLARQIADSLRARGARDIQCLDFPDQALAAETELASQSAISNSQSENLIAILLSGSYPWRAGIYDAVEGDMDRPDSRISRFAYSPGLTAADVLVLQQMSPEIQQRIIAAVEKRAKWFQDRSVGTVKLVSGKGSEYSLTIPFDMRAAPIVSSTGQLNDNHRKGNIPSGEAHLVPFPFRESNGLMATTGGLIIAVRDGFMRGINTDNARADLTLQERQIISAFNGMASGDEEHGLPLAELGLGVLNGLGVRPAARRGGDFEPSILTDEKRGPHGGFGVIAGESTQKVEINGYHPDGFTHADMLFDHPALLDHRGNPISFD